MDFLIPIIEKYKAQFKDKKDILDWVEHDLKHMGIEDIEGQLIKARTYLEVK